MPEFALSGQKVIILDNMLMFRSNMDFQAWFKRATYVLVFIASLFNVLLVFCGLENLMGRLVFWHPSRILFDWHPSPLTPVFVTFRHHLFGTLHCILGVCVFFGHSSPVCCVFVCYGQPPPQHVRFFFWFFLPLVLSVCVLWVPLPTSPIVLCVCVFWVPLFFLPPRVICLCFLGTSSFVPPRVMCLCVFGYPFLPPLVLCVCVCFGYSFFPPLRGFVFECFV